MRRNPYESERYAAEYLLLHYARPREVFPYDFFPAPLLRFHERLRKECLLSLPQRAGTRALDLGCAVGRFTFELGRVAESALGIDSSERFIEAAQGMARNRQCSVRVRESGETFRQQLLRLPASLRSAAVEFRVGNAMDLSDFPDGAFHIVAAINLLCRLPRPRLFLRGLGRLVVPGGQLLIASPFSWLREHSPIGEWLTGPEIVAMLGRDFRLVRRRSLPFLLREHRRKYELVISEALLFTRCDLRNKRRAVS